MVLDLLEAMDKDPVTELVFILAPVPGPAAEDPVVEEEFQAIRPLVEAFPNVLDKKPTTNPFTAITMVASSLVKLI